MIERIYGYPRDDKGRLVPREPEEEAESPEEVPHVYRVFWSARGATEEQIERLWQATQQHDWQKAARAMHEGIADLSGKVLDPERWQALELEAAAAWEEIAKEILGHGEQLQPGGGVDQPPGEGRQAED